MKVYNRLQAQGGRGNIFPTYCYEINSCNKNEITNKSQDYRNY